MKLPVSFTTLGDRITIQESPKEKMPGMRGSWNPRTGTISLAEGQREMEKIQTLIHEALHFSESILKLAGVIKRRPDHRFLDEAAFGVSIVLAYAGALDGVSIEDARAYINREKRRAARILREERKLRSGRKRPKRRK